MRVPLALVVAACVDPIPGLESGASDYPVYQAVLEELVDSAWFSPVLVEPRTAARQELDSATVAWLASKGATVSETLVAAYREANEHEVTLSDSLGTPPEIARLLSRIHVTIRDSGSPIWPTLRREVGENTVVVRFSRPGIDVLNGHALVRYTFTCGPSMCSEGHLVLLSWTGAEWRIDSDFMEWIA